MWDGIMESPRAHSTSQYRLNSDLDTRRAELRWSWPQNSQQSRTCRKTLCVRSMAKYTRSWGGRKGIQKGKEGRGDYKKLGKGEERVKQKVFASVSVRHKSNFPLICTVPAVLYGTIQRCIKGTVQKRWEGHSNISGKEEEWG